MQNLRELYGGLLHH